MDLATFSTRLLLHRQDSISKVLKRAKAQVPGLRPFVQVTDRLVIIQNGDVRGVFVAGIDHQAELKVGEVPLFQLPFRQLHADLIHRAKFLADGS